MARKKPADDGARAVRMFQYGTVTRDSVLLVLDTGMSDTDKLSYLRAWLTDTDWVPAETDCQTSEHWASLPAYCLPDGV